MNLTLLDTWVDFEHTICLDFTPDDWEIRQSRKIDAGRRHVPATRWIPNLSEIVNFREGPDIFRAHELRGNCVYIPLIVIREIACRCAGDTN
jgi:hypothetical protein